MNITDLLKLVRINNVLIIMLTQYFIEYLILRPGFAAYDLVPYLNHVDFFLLALCTGLIAAGGNIVNDLYDVAIDLVNRPHMRIVDTKISIENTYRLYIIIVILGAIIALYIAYGLGRLSLFGAYPLAVGLLWIYSRWFKRLPLSGNIIIAIFTSCVPLILLIPEWKNVISPGFRTSIYLFIVIGFSIFAGITTLLREIIKDLEDYKGDKSVGASTLPVVLGMKPVKRIALIILLILIGSIVSWVFIFYTKTQSLGMVYFSIVLIGLNVYLFYLLWTATQKVHYGRASLVLKIIMVSGLLYLLFL